MRKLMISMNISLDGFLSGPQGEIDWHTKIWNEQMGEQLLHILDRTDTILLGKNSYQTMRSFWLSSALQHIPRADMALADKIQECKKIVFSHKKDLLLSQDDRYASSSPREMISQLKKDPAKDLLVIGSGKLVHSILPHHIADEYFLWIHPILLGGGIPFFEKSGCSVPLILNDTFTFDTGVALLHYTVVR